jgi:predicted RNA-binding protein with PUA-like domain
MPAYWLIKSEPEVYPYAQLEAEKRTEWTGVRNFEARNNLRAMRVGDLCLYYHSVSEKALVGVARVSRIARPDPTAEDGDWASVEVQPAAALSRPVSLAQVKADPKLRDFALVTRSRLSVAPVSAAHFARILELAETTLR